MKLGVKRLSEIASVSLEFVDGEMQDETARTEKLRERTDIFARLLHDEPVAVRVSVCDALSEIDAVSYDVVRIFDDKEWDTPHVPLTDLHRHSLTNCIEWRVQR